MAVPEDESPRPEGTWAQKIAWILYDCGNSGYGLIIAGPLFSAYFVGGLLPEQTGLGTNGSGETLRGLSLLGHTVGGDAVWAVCTALGALITACAAPILGAVADIRGWTKRLFVAFALAGAGIAMTSIFLRPGLWLPGAIMFILSSFCFTTSITFYNAFLPVLARPEKQGSLSGYGFACGYVGGALALIIAAMFIYPKLGMPPALAFGGVWWLAFSLPAFFLLKETPPQRDPQDRGPLLTAGWRRVKGTFLSIRQFRMLFLFVLAFLLYSNGTDTVINISPAFGTQLLGMSANELVKVFLVVQFVAFAGAMACGWLSDRVGDKPVIIATLIGWVLAVGAVFFVKTPTQFMFAAIGVGLVLGGVQASSRSLMAKLAPEHIRNEAFGFFSLAGKAVSVVGPLCYAALSAGFGPRMGVLAVLPFLIAGLILILRVREPRATK